MRQKKTAARPNGNWSPKMAAANTPQLAEALKRVQPGCASSCAPEFKRDLIITKPVEIVADFRAPGEQVVLHADI